MSVVVQLGICAACYYFAFLLRFDARIPQEHWAAFVQTLPWILLIRAVSLLVFRLYEGLWRYTSIYDLKVLALAISAGTGVFASFLASPWGPDTYPRSVVVVDALLLLVALGGLRLSRRILAEISRGTDGSLRRVLVYGAGDAGQMIVREMKAVRGQRRPVGFIDDDPAKTGLRIHGVRVLGGGAKLADLVERTRPDEFVIATPNADSASMRRIVQRLDPFGIPVQTLPNLRHIMAGKSAVDQIRPLAVEDLLSRAPVGLSMQAVQRFIRGRRVVITGAGGSIGSEIARQVARLSPSVLAILDRYENGLHQLRLELDDLKLETQIRPLIADVTDADAIEMAFRRFAPEIVFHAAAHKHVGLMQENPCEAVKNNIRGTRIVAAAATGVQADRFILISTDKAANPSSVMGATKRVAELVVRGIVGPSATSYSVVRFGNVLGSNGSVVPRFMDQIRRGGPVTVTHPDVRRYFMTIPEAVQLVLHAAASATSSGTFVLDMGEQIRISELARNMIRMSGRIPDDEIKIVYTGLLPGEKLSEELVSETEKLVPTDVPKVSVVADSAISIPHSVLEALESSALQNDPVATLALLEQLTNFVGKAAPLVIHPQAVPVTHSQDFFHDRFVCPSCKATALRRSRGRSIGQRIRKRVTNRRPYKCDSCGHRVWIEPMSVSVRHQVDAPPAPNLKEVDRAVDGTR